MDDASQVSNTYLERIAIDAEINLSDGHARQPLTDGETRIVADFGSYYRTALRRTQSDAEQAFLSAFCMLAGEPTSVPTLFSYSASSLVAIAADWLKYEGLSVAMLEPGFDNIRDLLIRAQLNVTPVDATGIRALINDEPLGASLGPRRAIWLTLPNNPDGFALNEHEFTSLAERCAVTETLLVCDFCFRFYSREMTSWSQYDVLRRSGCRFITIEDTGKTLPLLDVKIGMLRCGTDFLGPLRLRNEEVALNVSPWILTVLAEVLTDYHVHGLDSTIWMPTERRRALVQAWIRRVEFSDAGQGMVPFGWISVPVSHAITALQIAHAGAARGVHVLTGHRFFFDHTTGDHYIRIPLSRPDEVLRDGLMRIEQALADTRP
jgi:aspartate/methionine/tyrosine aminotransferase